jgi:hypothetical protein
MSAFGSWQLDHDHLIVTLYSNSWTSDIISNRSDDAQVELDGDTLVLKDVDEHGNDRTRTYTKVK